ncbi:MAG TPA: hypothetical protein DCR14_20020 [Acidimicrobiaceae bacterium]|nr:hypothetical protein [Acidimicrobiaceae bacterium]
MAGEGREIELKLHVPSDAVAAVERALHDRTRSSLVHLQAAYFDTPAHDVAAAGLAWRVRRESNRWVQTLKGAVANGDGLVREEHNVPMKGRAWPSPDATVFAGTPAGDRLTEVLERLSEAGLEPPAERFRTDIHRLVRRQKVPGGTVEFAFDRGVIRSGSASTEVCELEIELVSGAPAAVIRTARRWAARYGLWADTVNKAMRGGLLADGATTAPVARGARPDLHAGMSVDDALRTITRTCLAQIQRNLSALANDLGQPEHVHMARVAIRKLRTVLRELGPLSPAVQPEWGDRLGEVFARLGEARDRDVLATHLPAIEAAGGPAFALPEHASTDAAEVARDPAVTALVLDLLEYSYGSPLADADDAPRLMAAVAGELKRLHRQTLREVGHFPTLPEEAQHQVRKRLKRLRYTAELTASIFPRRQVRAYVAALAPAQDALGSLNDLVVARDTFAAAAQAGVPEAWFASGWAAAQIPAAAAACVKPLRQAADAPRYWRTTKRSR